MTTDETLFLSTTSLKGSLPATMPGRRDSGFNLSLLSSVSDDKRAAQPSRDKFIGLGMFGACFESFVRDAFGGRKSVAEIFWCRHAIELAIL